MKLTQTKKDFSVLLALVFLFALFPVLPAAALAAADYNWSQVNLNMTVPPPVGSTSPPSPISTPNILAITGSGNTLYAMVEDDSGTPYMFTYNGTAWSYVCKFEIELDIVGGGQVTFDRFIYYDGFVIHNGKPTVLVQTFIELPGVIPLHRFVFAAWNGTSWESSPIAFSSGSGSQIAGFTLYSEGGSMYAGAFVWDGFVGVLRWDSSLDVSAFNDLYIGALTGNGSGTIYGATDDFIRVSNGSSIPLDYSAWVSPRTRALAWDNGKLYAAVCDEEMATSDVYVRDGGNWIPTGLDKETWRFAVVGNKLYAMESWGDGLFVTDLPAEPDCLACKDAGCCECNGCAHTCKVCHGKGCAVCDPEGIGGCIDGIFYQKDVIAPAVEAGETAVGFGINLSTETLIIPAEFIPAAFSIDGTKWRPVKNKLDENRFEKLLKKDLTLLISDTWHPKNIKVNRRIVTRKGPGTAAEGARIIRFQRVSGRQKIDKFSVNFGIYADTTGATAGGWALSSKASLKTAVRELRKTNALVTNWQVGVVETGAKTVDSKGFGVFCTGCIKDCAGIPVKTLDGATKAFRSGYILRIAPRGGASYAAASKPKRIGVSSELKAPNYKIKNKDAKMRNDVVRTPAKSELKVRANTFVTMNSRTAFYSDKMTLDLIGMRVNGQILIRNGATAKKPASAVQEENR
jgi:DNA-binding beta-propeller fold protein YncE